MWLDLGRQNFAQPGIADRVYEKHEMAHANCVQSARKKLER
jgi:hypothetical protein